MVRSMKIPGLLAAALCALVVVGCASQKEPAQAALAELEASLGKIAEQSQKYMPEEFAEVTAKLGELKASFDAGDYKAVIAAAPKVGSAVRKLQADAIIAKANFMTRMNEEWGQLATAMPDTIASVDRQIARLSSRGATPKGMTKDAFKEMVASFDSAKATWTAAAEAGNAGNFEDAVMKSREVKQVVDTVMQALGMSAG